MFANKFKAVVINRASNVAQLQETLDELKALDVAEYDILHAVTEQEVQLTTDGQGVLFEKKVYEYGLYTGNAPFPRAYLSKSSVARHLSHYIARNLQREHYYTLVMEDSARCL